MPIPVIIGVAEYTQHKEVLNRLDPLKLIEKSSREAISDASVEKIRDFIDSVYMVNISSWNYEDPPGELSHLLGIRVKDTHYLQPSGNSPQYLINKAAKAISKGESKAILITGGEALYTVNLAGRKSPANWPSKKRPKNEEGKVNDYDYIFESRYQLTLPSYSYALLETALRASHHSDLKTHSDNIGRLLEQFSKTASTNPNAWIKKSLSAQDISTTSKENRYVAYPYTKRMCANPYVDQAAAVLMTSEDIARELNINKKNWVYLMGGSDLENIFNMLDRPSLDDSPAIKEASRLALKQAGLTLQKIDMFDLYSCFPFMIQVAINEIGISKDDKRNLTVTGGLPYFGGPWSNYSMHAVVAAVKLIRENSKLKIMVLANGGFNSYESIGIYGTVPPREPWSQRDDSIIQKSINDKALPEHVEKGEDFIKVDGYTILYDRDNKPKKAVFIGRTKGDVRTYALLEAEEIILLELETQEQVGKKFKIKHDAKINRNIILL